ncbi:hypothetical protein M405DRAFT_834759 [Rhizopogon salebrosus TDB-379]|nr:hypothetical protein M405DRAFT_834759 [Rhizopogon salebrosus TDB-379]
MGRPHTACAARYELHVILCLIVSSLLFSSPLSAARLSARVHDAADIFRFKPGDEEGEWPSGEPFSSS